MRASQRGGLILGLVIGLLIGLGIALAVALWVTKAPVPFINKVPPRTAEQDAAEAQRNRNWDPNAPLAGKPAPLPPPSGPASAATPAASAATPRPAASAATPARPARDPAAILAGAPVPPAAAASEPRSAKPGTDAFIYFVQAGAFQNSNDAEQRRARVAMLGLESKITEREQSGRTVYRVRIGPIDKQAEADALRQKLVDEGVEAVLVRIERPAAR